jgi:Na+-driven multidrug efflux pump
VATGALRGTGDTRTPMVCHAVMYWLIGLPLGYFLGNSDFLVGSCDNFRHAGSGIVSANFGD